MLWQTLDALRILIKRYARQTDVVTGIELLNEPNSNVGVQIEPLKQVYYDGWGLTREASPHAGVVISDAFKGVPFWNGFMTSGKEAGGEMQLLDRSLLTFPTIRFQQRLRRRALLPGVRRQRSQAVP
jgi:aryl-phospho-beta-D-glucosidase BglC (GH1 family)